MNPNLVPTRIVNKNGVTTTVHKKPLGPSSTSNALPAPAVTALPTRALTEAQRSDMISKTHRRLWVIHGGRNVGTGMYHADAIRELMLTYPDNAVASMHNYIMTDFTGNRIETRNRTDFLNAVMHYATTGNAANEYLTFREHLTTSNHIGIKDNMAILRALHDYQQLPVMADYSEADQDTQEKITALLTVTQGLYNRYKEHQREALGSSKAGWGEPITVPDPLEFGLPLDTSKFVRLIGDDLINLITEQPENADEITRRILKDGINDSALLREIFESPAPALRDGLI
jgi:hypothetical protein